jgi:hypothetical protein
MSDAERVDDQVVIHSGTPSEVCAGIERLGGSARLQVVWIPLPDYTAADAQLVVKSMTDLLSSLPEMLRLLSDGKLQRFADSVGPAIRSHRIAAVKAKMQDRARSQVLRDDYWLSAGMVPEWIGMAEQDLGAELEHWERAGRIYSVCNGGQRLYPAYAFDKKSPDHLNPAIADVISIFAGYKDAWGVAFWMASMNSHLGGSK